uniref:hypothetical protein n=1 Tax=Neustupella aerophytica TaxID=2962111 RepID=UPI002182111B|nr:hypothetical protein N4K71_pgp084 [Neustupella aerophytica]UVI61115.1 hypothetical protein [Neustupella aerophytica]
MKTLTQKFTVSFEYSVYFTQGLFENTNLTFVKIFTQNPGFNPKIIFFIDSEVNIAHPNLIEQIEFYFQKYNNLPELVDKPLIIPGGELIKNNIQYLKQIYKILEKHKICRHSYIVGLGGGAMLDTIGFAASTAHRGIKLIRIPTTVLAQNDSAIGVKNAINFLDKKNFLGCFTPPFVVINDFNFLKTLEKRDWIAGIAEAIKVALIKDKNFFDFIEKNALALRNPYNNNMEPMKQLIYRCAELHLNHIGKSGDPFEKGSSRPLDFGHWSAHKLEYLTNYRVRHGEAVAIGIALDTTYSYLMGFLSKEDWQKILNTIANIGFELFIPELAEFAQNPDQKQKVLTALDDFQQHLGGKLTIILLKEIGSIIEVNEIDINTYQISIEKLKTFSTKQNGKLQSF